MGETEMNTSSGSVTYLYNGYIVATGDVCTSWVILNGMELWHPVLLAVLYAVALIYLFLGIAIIADKFMEAIEYITKKTVERKIHVGVDADGKADKSSLTADEMN